jgi:hypothetical protein
MSWRRYFPSAQFSLLAISLFISVGIVYGAQLITRPPQTTAQLDTPPTKDDLTTAVQNADWQKNLAEIQAQSGASLPTAPSQTTVNAWRQAAQTDNVTQTIGRTLFVDLANAKSQGLGNDAPTQDKIVQQALSMVSPPQSKLYTQQDLTIASSSKDALHTYGNALMSVLEAHSAASMQQTLVVIATANDNKNTSELNNLVPIEAGYRALAKDIATIPVPQTMAPFQLQVINDFVQIADTFPDMQHFIDDPVLGLEGLKQYQTLTGEAARVLTNIAQELDKDGILFASGEPGAGWKSVETYQSQ